MINTVYANGLSSKNHKMTEKFAMIKDHLCHYNQNYAFWWLTTENIWRHSDDHICICILKGSAVKVLNNYGASPMMHCQLHTDTGINWYERGWFVYQWGQCVWRCEFALRCFFLLLKLISISFWRNSIAKEQILVCKNLCPLLILGMDKQFHPTVYDGCNYLSMLGLKLNHVSEGGHWLTMPGWPTTYEEWNLHSP